MKRTIIALYGSVTLGFTLFSYLFISSKIPFLKVPFLDFYSDHRLFISIVYLFFIIILSILYVIYLFLWEKKRFLLKDIAVLIILSTVLLFLSYPAMLSYDIYNYMATAKVFFSYHENPYVVMPIEFINEPLLEFMHAANKYALYGIIWILLTGIPHLLHFNFISFVFSFKLLVIMFYILTILLIWKMTKKLYSIVFFSLNPLVMIETLVSGHNDIVMMFFVLFSLFLIKRKKIFLGCLFFLFSLLIKYATIFLSPLIIYCIWKTWKKIEIDWDKVYYVGFLIMVCVFFLAPFREEIYPWYAIWFLTFGALLSKKKFLQKAIIIFSTSLLFRYIPFMISGTHAGITPLIKIVITFLPISLFVLLAGSKKIWRKTFFHI